MSRFYSMYFKILVGLFIGVFVVSAAHASERNIPVDPFYARFDKADHIVFGTLEKIEPADVALEEFKEFDKKYLKKGTFKIERSWRGQKEGKIEFYFFPSADRIQDTADLAAKESRMLRLGQQNILYLRNRFGNIVAEERFGIITYFPGEPKASENPEYIALEALRKGKKMAEVVKTLPYWDQAGFSEYEKVKKKKN